MVDVSLPGSESEPQKNTKVYGTECRIYTGGEVKLELNVQVGETAGRIWHLLNDGGPQTMTQLKKKLNGSGELVGFALGWLAREEKVELVQDKKNLKVALR